MPANTVKVDRTTLFGNPFSIKDDGHDRAVACTAHGSGARLLAPSPQALQKSA
jgi:hypothetical protein